MKNKIKYAVYAFINFASTLTTRKRAFCNIAEGTHAGSITMTAGENIDMQNLLVSTGENEGEIIVAQTTSKPLGVCIDEGIKGEKLAVVLGGSTDSTFICRASSDIAEGDSVYSAPNGKVSAFASNGCYKIGVALCSATTGGVVEIDPQGFGESAWQFYSCGIYQWQSSTSTEKLSCVGLNENDVVIASIYAKGGSEKMVNATANSTGVQFQLDANGTAGATKIAWIVIRKN